MAISFVSFHRCDLFLHFSLLKFFSISFCFFLHLIISSSFYVTQFQLFIFFF